MKLLTHNMLTSHVKGVTKGYPLLIKATEVKVSEVEFNPNFVSRMIPKLEGVGYTLTPPHPPPSHPQPFIVWDCLH
uniref:tRNA methyltransferase activator subunit 11-2 n=1 Tax=Oncorhynchus mykiss TaxID=8022 RepID=A0A8C7P9Q1_ONCMY